MNFDPLMTFAFLVAGFAQRCAANLCPSARPGLASARARTARGITRSARPKGGRTGIRGSRCAKAHAPLRARGAAPLSLRTKKDARGCDRAPYGKESGCKEPASSRAGSAVERPATAKPREAAHSKEREARARVRSPAVLRMFSDARRIATEGVALW